MCFWKRLALPEVVDFLTYLFPLLIQRSVKTSKEVGRAGSWKYFHGLLIQWKITFRSEKG